MQQLADQRESGLYPLTPVVHGAGYEVFEVLGTGAMGVVHRGRCAALDRGVAIKFIQRHLAASATFVDAFAREAKIAARIDHPNVTRILDFGRCCDGRPFIVMELLRGHTLAELLDVRRTPPVVWSLEIISQLLDGLAAMHEQGIVHGDIKPENLFVEQVTDVDGQHVDRLKVCDFGIARVNDAAQWPTLVLAGGDRGGFDGQVCGTPGYMAREQWLGTEVDARTDVYGAGVVLYELLAGALPFPAEEEAAETACVSRIALPPSRVRPQVCRALDGVLLKALQTHPSRRYQSARAMRTALIRCLSDQVPSRVPTYRAAVEPRPSSTPTGQPTETPVPRAQEPPDDEPLVLPERRWRPAPWLWAAGLLGALLLGAAAIDWGTSAGWPRQLASVTRMLGNLLD